VTLSLPDDLRVKLRTEGLSDDEMLLMTGDELVERIGARATYELVVALEACGLAIAHYPGRRGRRSTDDQLRARNIEMVRMRLIEHMSYTEIARAVGLSKPRVSQILGMYFGLDKKIRRPKSVTIPVEALASVREALRMYLLSVVDDLRACLSTGEPDMADEWKRLDLARGLLRDVDTADDDVEVFGLGRDRGTTLIKALRDHLPTERHLGHDADVAAIERLLSAL